MGPGYGIDLRVFSTTLVTLAKSDSKFYFRIHLQVVSKMNLSASQYLCQWVRVFRQFSTRLSRLKGLVDRTLASMPMRKRPRVKNTTTYALWTSFTS